MLLTAPPTIFRDPELDRWLRELWSGLLFIPASENAPNSSTSEGSKGEMAFDDDYFYVCVSKDTWKRVALSNW